MSGTSEGTRVDVDEIESIAAVLNGPPLLPQSKIGELVGLLVKQAPALCARVRELEAALDRIVRTEPVCGLDPKARVGARDAFDWNVHDIARAALAPSQPEAAR
jgi:hypothetical protein